MLANLQKDIALSQCNLCTTNDEWYREYSEGNPVWITRLDDDTIIYQNDGRYNQNENHNKSWQNLRYYCYKYNRNIIDVSFGFRSNRFSLPPHMSGYFFSRAIRANFGGNVTLDMWSLGWIDPLDSNNLIVQKWKVPEMILDETNNRYIDRGEIEEYNECLILNNTYLSTVPRVSLPHNNILLNLS